MLFLQLRGRLHQRFVHLHRAAIYHHSSGWVKWCLLLFFISQILFSQEHLGRVTSDFRISSDSTPSIFSQYSIELLPTPDSGFIAKWDDYRDGDRTTYAQKFDRAGNRIGTNYKPLFNQSITYTSDGYSLQVNSSITDEPWNTKLFVTGTVVDPIGNPIKSIPLADAYIPWCGTGYLGIDYYYASSKERFYFLFSDDGRLSLSRIYKDGSVSSVSQESLGIYRAYNSSVSSTSKDDYILGWTTLRRIERDDSDGYFVNNRMESWGTFYGANDSTYLEKVSLGLFTDTNTQNRYTYVNKYSSLIKTISLNDSVYIVFGLQLNPMALLYKTFSKTGVALDTVKSIDIPFSCTDYLSFQVGFSNIRNNMLKIFLSGVMYGTSYHRNVSALFTFDADGEPLNTPIFDSTKVMFKGNWFMNIDEHTSVIGIESGGDVYLATYRDLTLIDSIKVNDDSLGSNEFYSSGTALSSSGYFVQWSNGQDFYGRQVTKDGEYVGPVRNLEKQNKMKFFSDGTSIELWVRDTTSRYGLGFTLRDADWNVQQTTMLWNDANSSSSSDYNVMEVLSDSTFVVAYPNSNWSIELKLFNKNGVMLSVYEYDVSYGGISSIEIVRHQHSSFLVRCSDKMRTFSNSLEPLTDQLPCKNGLMLSLGIILSTEWDSHEFVNYGRLYSLTGDTLSERFLLSRGISSLQLQKLTENTFIALTVNGNTLYARTFNIYGQIDHDSTVIYVSEFGAIQYPTCTVSGDDILFTWAEKRPTGRGYDIYGTTVGISNLLSTPNTGGGVTPRTLTLFQNYPNPFNPTTMIQYITTAPGDVTLSIFDVLGREVVRLVDGYRYMGEHIVTWDAEGVPSGVYFYRVTSNDITVTKKLMLLH